MSQPERTAQIVPGQRGLPSILDDPHVPHDHLRGRIGVVRDNLIRRGTSLPEEHAHDEHFLFTVYKNYLAEAKNVRKNFPISHPHRWWTRRKTKERIRKEAIARVQNTALTSALRTATREIELEKTAATDTLTGAWSRGAIDNFITNLLSRPNDGTTGVIFLDLDRFKEYNDKNGHDAGDELLINFIRKTTELTEDTDQIGRYGGEEFVIVLPDTGTLENLTTKAENIRREIESHLGVTISMGLTMIETTDATKEDIYRRSDIAVYAAKGLGRNRSVTLKSMDPVPVIRDLTHDEDYIGRPQIDPETKLPKRDEKGRTIYSFSRASAQRII